MRVLLILAWVAGGVLFYAWHSGPGQDLLALDDAGRLATKATTAANDGRWSDAISSYDSALALLPEDRQAEARRLRLERGRRGSKAAANFRKLEPNSAHSSTSWKTI
ncbi:MAG: hypothetical protein QM775_31780 [Pirellulales bacterium]